MNIKFYVWSGVIALSVLLPASQLQARPVSYPGGWTVMVMNDGESNSLHTHYSPSVNYSIGLRNEYHRDKEYYLNSMQVNNLLKRWNKGASQANIYLKSGIGSAYTDHGDFDHKQNLAGFTGLAADWETRRWFTSYENRYVHAGSIDTAYSQKARLGVAPYIGDFGDLHTWMMVEIAHQPEDEDQFTVTPLVRLFKGPVLTEAGMSLDGNILFNFVYRF